MAVRALWWCALAAALGCSRAAPATRDADAAVTLEASAPDAAAVDASPEAAAVDASADAEPSLEGEWERATEPYKGMRVVLAGDADVLRATVRAPPPVTAERLASMRSVPPALARAQLECQRSLWREGEALMFELRRSSRGAASGTYLVRDWGLTSARGPCRHSDSRAPARLSLGEDGELAIAVTRGATVTQRWTRVR